MTHHRLRLMVALAALAVFASIGGANAASSELFFSEYVEGSGNNKALEIYNGTASPVVLTGNYDVQVCFNGATACTLTIPLVGTIAPGDVFVLAHALANATILAVANQTNGAGWFNGDDAVLLRRGATLIDSIGQRGVDPGLEWGVDFTSTADNTLRRKAGIEAGDTNDTDAFDPAVEWDGFVTDTFDGLGIGPVPPPTNPTGTGTATPASVPAGDSTLLTVSVTPGANPTSTGLSVTSDLSSIGGAAAQPFVDNGSGGDAAAGDNVFSYTATVASATSLGSKSLPVAITDAQSRAGSTSIALTVTTPTKPPSLGTPLVLNEFRTRGPAGGNDEFVELYNASSSSIAIGGLKLNGSNSAGTVSTRATIPAGRVLGAGCHYLFTNAGSNGYTGSVAGDQTYTTGVTDDGGIALLAADNTILDQAGLSSGSAYGEGTRLTSLGSTNADRGYGRDPAGYDTNDNANDFVLVSPSTPQSRAACGGVISATGAAAPSSVPVGTSTLLTVSVTPGGNPASTGLAVSADLSSIGGSAAQAFSDTGTGGDATANDNVFSYSAAIPAGTALGSKSLPATASDAEGRSASTTIDLTVEGPPTLVPIHEIQGAAHISPRIGELLTTRGIVTAKIGSSFYMQDPSPDADPATSEGIQVFGSTTTNAVSIGELVTVQGRVTEFRASSSASPNPNLSVTELTSPQLLAKATTTDTIAPSLIGNGGRIPPNAIFSNDAVPTGNVETSGAFDPAEDGLDFWESFEGMLVQMNDLLATSFTFTNFGEVFVLGDNGANASVVSPAGSVVISGGDLNPERIVIDDEWFKAGGPPAMPAVNVGGTFPGAHVGIMDWAFGEYRVQLRERPTVGSTGISVRESSIAAGTDQLSVATFNVENLSGGEGDAKYNALAAMIVNNLASPDILGLEEIQDNNGAVGGTGSPVVDANVTLDRLVAAIQAAGGPAYQWRQINPVAHQDGGEPGGNIRVGFLFRTDRGLSFVDRPGGDSTTAVSVVPGPDGPTLSVSPGRIAPTSSAWSASRKPLVGEFAYNGHKLFVVVNHFNSKGGDQLLFGPWQPPTFTSEVQRNQQATLVAGFVSDLLAADPTANVAVVGDINDFQFSNPMNILKAAGLHALIESLPPNERYSYNFDGNAQALDHILVSGNLFDHAAAAAGYDIVHVNAGFLDQISDHDPQLVRLTMPAPSLSASRSPAANAAGWNNSAVTVGFACVDPLSAILGSCPAAVTLSTEGADQSVSRSVSTEGGATLTAGVANIDIDLTNPVVTYSGANATYGVDESVAITCSASDALSGIASSTCTNISGPAASFGPGTHTFSASALDRAGNTGTGSVTFTVVVTHTGLCGLVRQYVDKEGVASALCAKLEAAAAKVDRTDQEADLHAFVNQVEAQSGKSMTADEAATLIRLAGDL